MEERAGRLPKIGIGSHQWHLLDDTSGGAHRWEVISDIFWELLDEKSSVAFPHQESEMHLLLPLKSSPQSHPIKILSLATATLDWHQQSSVTPPQREVITNDSLVAKSPMAGFSTTTSSKQARSLEIAIGTIEKSHIHRHHIFKSPASPLTVKVIIIFSRSNKANIIKLPQTPSSSSSYKCRFRNQVCEHWCNHNLHIFIGPRYPWSDLWVQVSLTHAIYLLQT